MNLEKEQIEKRDAYYIRLKGRHGVITNPYYTRLAKDARFQIQTYMETEGVFKVIDFNSGAYGYCLADEFQIIDKEFSDFKIVKKGIRVERKDKFGDRFMIELQNNKRDIYLSSASVSLLNMNQEENYVGFASDPDTGRMYIFSADNASGYLLNKDNNRITSTADWREMFKLYETMNFEITPQPIIDNNNPGFIFYTVKANYEYFGKQEQPTFNNHKNTKQKVKDNIPGRGLVDKLTYDTEEIPVTWAPKFVDNGLTYDDDLLPSKTDPQVKTTGLYYNTTDQIIREKLNEIRKIKNSK